MPKRNLSQYNDDFQQLPIGRVLCQVSAVKETTSGSGTEGISVGFVDAHGPIGWSTFWLTPKSGWRYRQLAEACGLSKEQRDDNAFEDEMLIGRLVVLNTVEEEYKGKPQTKVESCVRPNDEDRAKWGGRDEAPVTGAGPNEPDWVSQAPKVSEPPAMIDDQSLPF